MHNLQTKTQPTWFRTARGHRGLVKVYTALEHFRAKNGREYHDAVRAGEMELAVNILDSVGLGQVASRLVPAMKEALERAATTAAQHTGRRRAHRAQAPKDQTQQLAPV